MSAPTLYTPGVPPGLACTETICAVGPMNVSLGEPLVKYVAAVALSPRESALRYERTTASAPAAPPDAPAPDANGAAAGAGGVAWAGAGVTGAAVALGKAAGTGTAL